MTISDVNALKAHLTQWRVKRLTENARGADQKDVKPQEALQYWLKQPTDLKEFFNFGIHQGMVLLPEEQWHILKGSHLNVFVEGVARAILQSLGTTVTEPKLVVTEALNWLKAKVADSEDVHF